MPAPTAGRERFGEQRFPMVLSSTEWELFLGRFHPVMVHLPIGGLVMLGILETVALFTRWKMAADNRRWILGILCCAAVIAAACGWMLGSAGGYDERLLKWHRTTGVALAGGCLLTLLLAMLAHRTPYYISLGAMLPLLAIASHLGGSITHGRGYLTRYAPALVRTVLGATDQPLTPMGTTGDMWKQPVFAGVIHPILEQHCCTCHGVEKQKGGLRLDTIDGIMAGGDYGATIDPGSSGNSLMIERIKLPLDHDDHMPPDGKPQLIPEEVLLLEWWIDAGAPLNKNVEDLQPDDRVKEALTEISE